MLNLNWQRSSCIWTIFDFCDMNYEPFMRRKGSLEDSEILAALSLIRLYLLGATYQLAAPLLDQLDCCQLYGACIHRFLLSLTAPFLPHSLF